MFTKKIPTGKINEVKEAVKTSARLLKLVWDIDRRLFIVTFLVTIIPSVVPFINLYIYKLVIDLVIKSLETGVLNPSVFYPLIALRFLTAFLQDASFRSQDFFGRLMWTKVPIELNQMFLGKLASLDIQYFENDKFRDLMEKSRESINYRPQNLIDNLLFLSQSSVQFLIALIALAKLNWFFIILILLISVPEFINQTLESKLSWGIWGQNSPLRKRYNYLMHILQGHREIKEVRIFKLAKKLLSEIRSLQEKFYVDNKKLAQRQYSTSLIFKVLSTGVFIGIEAFVILQAIAKKLTVGDINFYTGVVTNFQSGLGGLLRNANQIFESSLYVKSIFEVLDSKNLIKESENPVKLTSKGALVVEFKDVDFAYPGSDKKILRHFSMAINPGEKIAFVGENGAGKSTIIKLLARFYDVDKGDILIDGYNIKDLDLTDWYYHLGVLFQDFNRYEHTVKENIYFGKVHEEMNMEKIIEAATSSGAHKFVKDYKKGYEQILGKMFEEGVEPSGGQWQKIALARAFFRNAPILVLDEPTASIDARAESEIFNKVEKLSKDKTVIIISHRFSTVRNADKIYVIDSGKIVEEGDHQSLMKLDGQYASLFNLQAKGYQ